MWDASVFPIDPEPDNLKMSEAPSLDCDPQLVEAALFSVLRGTAGERDYQLAREACYEVSDLEARDRAFAAMNHQWFSRLRLARPVHEALVERPSIAARTDRCILARAIRRQDECAELYGPMENRLAVVPHLLIRLRPESFGSPPHIVALLRHELMHIVDMLEPEFGYDPSPAQFHDVHGVPTLVRDRYRVLWDTHIDGRLTREGRTGAEVRAARFSEFKKAFPLEHTLAADVFERLFAASDLSHGELMTFARQPHTMLDWALRDGSPGNASG